MQPDFLSKEHAELAERLHEVVDRMLEPFGKRSQRSSNNALNPRPMPFDVSKANFHDSKAEFQAELARIQKSIDAIEVLWSQMAPRSDDDAENKRMVALRSVLSEAMRLKARFRALDSPIDLIRKNASDVDGTISTLLISLDFLEVLKSRMDQLEEQKELYWNLRHRAPDYYARSIALRLAKLYARETRSRPTLGTSGETGEPSTGYLRALSDTFNVLDISTGVRSPAEWAVQQINEEDLEPRNALGLFGFKDASSETEDRYSTLGGILGLNSPETSEE